MMKTIDIRHFGPIKEGAGNPIEIKKVTLFIGDQGSGKSTVVKLLSIFSWMEKALVKGYVSPSLLERKNHFKKNRCKYHNIDNYFHKDTYICYQGNAYKFIFDNDDFSVEKIDGHFVLPKVMYIPAERNFLSVVKKPFKINDLPGNTFTFSELYQDALTNGHSSIELPINSIKISYDKLNKLVSVIDNGVKLKIEEASSGYQSVAPLYITSNYLVSEILERKDTKSNVDHSVDDEKELQREIAKIQNRTDISEQTKWTLIGSLTPTQANKCLINIVEEPEQNLYPTSQQIVLFDLLKITNKIDENQLIITTHSPYLVSYLTLAIKAKELLGLNLNEEQTQHLGAIVPVGASVSTDHVEIYEIRNGRIYKVKKYEGLPVDTNMLNELLDFPNQLFDELLDIEEQCPQTF